MLINPENFVNEYSLFRDHQIENTGDVYWNLSTPALYEEALKRNEGQIVQFGPLVVETGHHTGRSPNDKFIVKEPSSQDKIWWGNVNVPISKARFDLIHSQMLAYLQGREIFVQDCYAGADPQYRISVRIINEYAWHNLFIQSLLIPMDSKDVTESHTPDFTIIDLPQFHARPEIHGTNSETFILVNFHEKLVLIGGTKYAGEMKKSVFTYLNYQLPEVGVFPMHCSANMGPDGDVALFFGLSGTGKTTLSSVPGRQLIGDDEHGWSDRGIFNFEGGCYAKTIRLSSKAEPEIYACTRKFGTVLENVILHPETRKIDLDDGTLTENTRAGYPITHLDNIVPEGVGGHPSNLIMLTCDAFGVMPPVAKLTPEQAMYHFLSGYTAKVAGTERGLGNEPQATFSYCFGDPFMPLNPTIYANMLGERIKKHDADCWLINTGWSGGPFGEGERMEISYTRAIVDAVLSGKLANVPTEPDPIFGIHVPITCEGVPSEVLKPRNTWDDGEAYDAQAIKLAQMFVENFKQFGVHVTDAVRSAGPNAG